MEFGFQHAKGGPDQKDEGLFVKKFAFKRIGFVLITVAVCALVGGLNMHRDIAQQAEQISIKNSVLASKQRTLEWKNQLIADKEEAMQALVQKYSAIRSNALKANTDGAAGAAGAAGAGAGATDTLAALKEHLTGERELAVLSERQVRAKLVKVLATLQTRLRRESNGNHALAAGREHLKDIGQVKLRIRLLGYPRSPFPVPHSPFAFAIGTLEAHHAPTALTCRRAWRLHGNCMAAQEHAAWVAEYLQRAGLEGNPYPVPRTPYPELFGGLDLASAARAAPADC
jgi:hypothetical protein